MQFHLQLRSPIALLISSNLNSNLSRVGFFILAKVLTLIQQIALLLNTRRDVALLRL
jgi:hypothetical protein